MLRPLASSVEQHAVVDDLSALIDEIATANTDRPHMGLHARFADPAEATAASRRFPQGAASLGRLGRTLHVSSLQEAVEAAVAGCEGTEPPYPRRQNGFAGQAVLG